MSEQNAEKKHKGFKLFILIFLFISMLFLKEENRDKAISFIDSFTQREKQLELLTSIDISEILSINAYENTISLWKENKLSIFDMKGTLELEKQFSFEDPIVHFGKNNIYIGDKSTGDIYKLNKNGETEDRISLKRPFLNMMEENENIIYHTKDEGQESIYIHNKDDVLIGDHSFSDKAIISYATSSNEDKYLLSTLDLSESILKSKLTLYGENKAELNALDIDEEIVIYSKFIKNDDIIVLTDKSIYYIKNGKIMWNKTFNLIKDIYIEDTIYILYSNYLESIDFEGRTVEKVGFNKDYENILPFNNDILVYGDSHLTLIHEGKQVLSHEENIDIISANKKNIIILNGDRVDIYKVSR